MDTRTKFAAYLAVARNLERLLAREGMPAELPPVTAGPAPVERVIDKVNGQPIIKRVSGGRVDYGARRQVVRNTRGGARRTEDPMTDPVREALLPCPFCGGIAELVELREHPNEGGWIASCADCRCCTRVVFPCKEDARPHVIEAWNRRAALAAPNADFPSLAPRGLVAQSKLTAAIAALVKIRSTIGLLAAYEPSMDEMLALRGELGALVHAVKRIADDPEIIAAVNQVVLAAPAPELTGDKIVAGLRDAIAGHFTRVTLARQVWERAEIAEARGRASGIEEAARAVAQWSPASANTDAWLRERDLVAAEIRALAHQPAPAGWQDIGTAPKDGTPILLAWGGQTRLGKWLDNSRSSMPWAGWRTPSNETTPPGQPTHWRPLPAPPAPAKGEG